MVMTMLDKPGQLPIGLAALTALAAGMAAYTVFSAHKPLPGQSREIIPSPLSTLIPRLSKDQIARTAYPPTALPGGRDVDTPYGSMRVYEWGPEDGRKVLFVHGDGTPSPIFRPIADELVSKGCRVMTFDLWGRGYTDTPADSQHDSRLYGLQILYALISSPIAWGASAPFSIVGYSMGGTIVLDFFAHNPTLVESVILLAPGGMIRELPLGYRSVWYWYPFLTRKSTMRRLIGDLLGVRVTGTTIKSADEVELSDEGFTPARAQQWQFDHHHGHVVSFLSTIQYAPLQYQDKIWKRAGDVIKGANASGDAEKSQLFGSKILCLCGADDPVVLPHEVKDGLDKYMGGSNHFEYKTVPSGHGFPWTEGPSVAADILDFWARNPRKTA